MQSRSMHLTMEDLGQYRIWSQEEVVWMPD